MLCDLVKEAVAGVEAQYFAFEDRRRQAKMHANEALVREASSAKACGFWKRN
jgi:hypothetical protein